MNKIYTVLCVSVFFACSKEQTPITPSEEPKAPPPVISEEPKAPTGQCSPTAIAPPAFKYNAALNVSIGGAKDTLHYDASVKDYGPIIKDRVNALYWKGGGTLYIAPGKYPVKSSTNHTFYPTSGIKKLAIQGIPNGSGSFPELFDKDITGKPHSFIEFSSTPADHIEFYISNIEITGNNIPLDDNHPFYMKNSSAKGIFFANIEKGEITNTKISNMYGDGIQIYNWANDYLTDYNIGQGIKVANCYLINNWSDNGKFDSGDGIMFFHVNKPSVINTVISNNYTQQKKYGRGGIVIEAGTKDAKVESTFMQGYRNGVICERGFGGHLFQNNTIYNNQQSGISFAHSMTEVNRLGPAAYKPNKILNNHFEFHQYYRDLSASLWSFVVFYTNSDFALAGTEISGNTFIAHEKNSPVDKDNWWTVGNPYNFFIKTNGQQDLVISDNTYNSPSN